MLGVAYFGKTYIDVLTVSRWCSWYSCCYCRRIQVSEGTYDAPSSSSSSSSIPLRRNTARRLDEPLTGGLHTNKTRTSLPSAEFRHIAYIVQLTVCSAYRVKLKVKVGFLYSAAYAITGPARFTISEVAVDWQELMMLQRKLRPSNCTR